MGSRVKEDTWVWVVVQDPGAREQFLGQHDSEKDVSFIPAYLEKEEANRGMKRLVRDENRKYEVQAIQAAHLLEQAGGHGFQVFLLDGEGTLIEKIVPEKNVH